MRVFVDEKDVGSAHNYTKIVIIRNDYERHVTITDEGIIEDIVVNGEVEITRSLEHEEFLWGPEE